MTEPQNELKKDIQLAFAVAAIEAIGREANAIAEKNGWWKDPEWLTFLKSVDDYWKWPHSVLADLEKAAHNERASISLMQTELSEVVEALRRGNHESTKIQGFSQAEEEYADVIIRILSNGVYRGHRIGPAIVAKMEYNRTRNLANEGKQF